MQGHEANSCLIPRETKSMEGFSSLFIFLPAEVPVCPLPLPKNPITLHTQEP